MSYIDNQYRMIFKEVAERKNLSFSKLHISAVGQVNGYNVSVIKHAGNICPALQFTVSKDGYLPSKEVLSAARKTTKGIANIVFESYRTVFLFRGGTNRRVTENIVAAIENLTVFFKENGYTDATDAEILPVADIVYRVNDDAKENVLLGFLGAIIGSVFGICVIFLLGQFGFIAGIGGAALAVGVLFGYKTLGRKLSIRGIVISVIIMLIVTYLTSRLTWSVALYKEISEYMGGVSLKAVFFNFHPIISELGITGRFIKDLIMLYIFTAIGAYPTIKKNYYEEKFSEVSSNNNAA